MACNAERGGLGRRRGRVLQLMNRSVIAALAALMIVTGLPVMSSPAAAQEQSLVDLQLWGRLQVEFRINDDGLDLGTAWRQSGYNLSLIRI